MKHQAILELYPEVKVIHEDENGSLTFCDSQGDPIAVVTDETAINNKIAELETADKWQTLRTKRTKLLAETDHLALSDHVLSAEMTAYRQALRDLPANTTDPANPVFPTKPGA